MRAGQRIAPPALRRQEPLAVRAQLLSASLLGGVTSTADGRHIPARPRGRAPGKTPSHSASACARWRRTAEPARDQLLGPRLHLPAAGDAAARPLARSALRSASARLVAGQVVSGRGLEPEDQAVQEPPARRRAAASELPVLGGQEDRRRQPGRLAEPGAACPRAKKRRPASRDHATRSGPIRSPAQDARARRTRPPSPRHVGRARAAGTSAARRAARPPPGGSSCPARSPRPAESRRREGDGVRGEVAEAWWRISRTRKWSCSSKVRAASA